MSDAIYADVIRTKTEGIKRERERVEIIVEVYERADCVKDHESREIMTKTNTHQPLQHTGDQIHL